MAKCPNCELSNLVEVDIFRSEDVTMYGAGSNGGLVRNQPLMVRAGFCTDCGTLQESADG